MKLKHFLLILVTVTSLSLFFVSQETLVVRLAYQENLYNRRRKELLDSNRYLRYNLISLKSSSYLADKLLNETSGFELPKESQVLSLALPQENTHSDVPEAKAGLPAGKAGLMSKLQESWPIVLVKSYVNKQVQAQDLNR